VPAAQLFDTYVIDGIANAVGFGAKVGSGGLRMLQTGQVQVYGTLGFIGIVLAGLLTLWLNPL
jgi:hypothetical protein